MPMFDVLSSTVLIKDIYLVPSYVFASGIGFFEIGLGRSCLEKIGIKYRFFRHNITSVAQHAAGTLIVLHVESFAPSLTCIRINFVSRNLECQQTRAERI